MMTRSNTSTPSDISHFVTVKYVSSPTYQPAFGWGFVVAKTAAGVLYPTFFFLVLSMVRWFSMTPRRWEMVSRFKNWDLAQGFHIKVSSCALFFATLHAIGHLTCSFVFGSQTGREAAITNVREPDRVPRIRRWNNEVF
jgi:dual oxidase